MEYKNKIGLSLIATALLINGGYAKDIKNLNTVTVTANKIEERVQEVPISMSVFDEYTIEDRKIESIKDLAPHTSNFALIDRNGGYIIPSVRGISNTSGYALGNPISIIVDGVSVTASNGFNELLMDVERIEVLKGPQVTLYGKDTQAGAINVITKKPDNETRAKIGVELGEDNKRQYTFSASGPIVKDKFYVGLSAKHYEKDGFIKNTLLGGYSNDKENNYGKLHLRFTPSDKLEISVISSKTKVDDGNIDLVNTNLANAGDKSIHSDVDSYTKSDTVAYALKISYDIDDYHFESITTTRNRKVNDWQDYVSDIFKVGRDDTKSTQEFRISNSNDSFKWVAGIYGETVKQDEDSAYIYPNFTYPVIQKQDGDSIGVFAHGDYSINDKLSFISGIRYDRDKREFEDPTSNIEFSDSEVSPKISLKYQQNKSNMYYATIAKGYRAGGFHPYAPTGYSKQYAKEVLWNYEIGAKNSFLDNKLILNSSLFFMDISDMQVKVNTNANNHQNYIANAAKATAKGFELEVNGKLTDDIEIFGSYGYTDITYDDFKDAKGDYSGNTKNFAPKYNYNIGIQYRDENGYFARADINGYGKTYFNKENTSSRDAYSLVNMKVGYEADNYDIYLYGKNIFDKDYSSVNQFNFNETTYSAPREIGIQLAYRF